MGWRPLRLGWLVAGRTTPRFGHQGVLTGTHMVWRPEPASGALSARVGPPGAHRPARERGTAARRGRNDSQGTKGCVGFGAIIVYRPPAIGNVRLYRSFWKQTDGSPSYPTRFADEHEVSEKPGTLACQRRKGMRRDNPPRRFGDEPPLEGARRLSDSTSRRARPRPPSEGHHGSTTPTSSAPHAGK